jgi:hypothetical protein
VLLHAVIVVTSHGRRRLPPMPPSAHGLYRAVRFFLAYFEYHRRISTGNLHGHS